MEIADEFAPGIPRAAAIGCAIGSAIAGLSCGFEFAGK
jgi:hypothetical protein